MFAPLQSVSAGLSCIPPSSDVSRSMLVMVLTVLVSAVRASGPEPRGPPVRRHNNIKLDIEQERESVFQDRNISILFDISSHIKDQVKEVYLDTSAMDDEQLLMQFFKKRDTDNNMKLDGLELLRALVDMEGETFKTFPNIIITFISRGREPPSRRS